MDICEDCRPLAYIADGDGDSALVGQPVITERRCGKGKALYIGTKLLRKDGAEFLAKYVLDAKEFAWKGDRKPLYIERVREKERYLFYE